MDRLFAYTDYRRFLQDWYEERKRTSKHFSLRLWAEKSGFKARDYLLRVMRGDRNMSLDGAEKLSNFFRFSEKQAEYFKTLVQFNQAPNTLEKERCWRRLSEIQKYGSQQKLRHDQFEYFSSWYHSALRSLLPVMDCGDDWEKVARLLNPPITPKQAKDSVDLLLRLGLLQREGRGRYTVSHPALSTGDEIASLAVAGFHKASMELVKRSIDRHPAPARDISGVTMSLSRDGFQRIKGELRAFRKKVMAIASEDSAEDMVYQLNLHFIPLTRARGGMKPEGPGKGFAGRVPAFPAAALAALAAFALWVSLALAACVGDDRYPDGPSTETGNPALAGILRDTLGRPAAGALVKLYRHHPDTFPSIEPMRLDSFRTGADGAYRFDSLEGGTYALEALDAARRAFSFLPSAEVPAGDDGFRRRDTLVLKRPGRVRGIALRDSNPRPPDVAGEAGILVRFIGLDRATYTDSAGRYAFADIPEGTYNVHFMASDGHYLGQTAGPVPVASGAEVELDTVVLEWSPFVDPPAPDGLSVTPDSASGVIRLRWNPVHLPNFDHYRILRSDSLSPAAPDTFRTRETAYADTVRHLPAGRVLNYRVQAVNTLGNASRNEVPRPVTVPPPVGPEPGNLEVAALVLSGGAPARALVRLYALSPVPDPTERVPSGITLVDSAQAGADGRVRFAGRAAGLYTLIAAAGTGTDAAARVGIPSRPDGGAPDTLRLAAPGTLTGEVTRGGLWCTNDQKLNQNIQVSLAGTPWFHFTQGGGGFEIAAVPAGAYRVAIAAVPKGCTLPDTLAAVILPGQAAVLPTLTLRPAPDYIPMITDLRAAPAAGGKVFLQWTRTPPAYTRLQGYEAVRRDSSGAVTASSGLLAEPAWTDDVSGLPSGTVVSYLVRVVRDDGVAGRFGGARFDPLYFTVP